MQLVTAAPLNCCIVTAAEKTKMGTVTISVAIDFLRIGQGQSRWISYELATACISAAIFIVAKLEKVSDTA